MVNQSCLYVSIYQSCWNGRNGRLLLLALLLSLIFVLDFDFIQLKLVWIVLGGCVCFLIVILHAEILLFHLVHVILILVLISCNVINNVHS